MQLCWLTGGGQQNIGDLRSPAQHSPCLAPAVLARSSRQPSYPPSCSPCPASEPSRHPCGPQRVKCPQKHLGLSWGLLTCCYPSSEPPTNNSFINNGILPNWHLKWLYWVKKMKVFTGAQLQSRQKAKIISEPFCPAHPHLRGCCCPGAAGRNSPLSSLALVHWMMLLLLKKGDQAWILGHFGAPHTTEVMTAITAGVTHGLVCSSSATDCLCDLEHIT